MMKSATYRHRYAIGLAATIAAMVGPSTSAQTVIYDPTNHGKNIRQNLALIEQVLRADRQIELQEQMLARQPTSNWGSRPAARPIEALPWTRAPLPNAV